MDAKILSGKATFESDSSFDSDRFMKLRVRVLHSGKNYNYSTFSLDAIENAKGSLANIPILANVVENEDGTLDFGGHDMRLEENKMKEGEYKIIYEEKVIGVVPETNEYELVEHEGKTYVVCSAYVFKDYSNYAQDLLEKQDEYSVSMEILVDDYSVTEQGLFDITNYRYTGITVLGTEILPAMKNAGLEVQKFSLDETQKVISQYAQELKAIFEAKETSADEDEPEVEPEENKEEEMGCGDKKKYELTVCAKLEKLADSMENEWVYDEDGNLISGKTYYVFDMTDEFALISMWEYASDWTDVHKYVKAKYDAETLTVDKSTIVEVFSQWLTKEEMDLVDANKIQADFALAEMQTKVETLSNENALLSEFKATVERQIAEQEAETLRLAHEAEIDAKLAEFEDEIGSVDEFKTLKENAYSMGADEIELKCFAIVGKNKHKPSKVTKPVVQKPTVSFCSINAPVRNEDENKPEIDYGEYNKYIKNGGK